MVVATLSSPFSPRSVGQRCHMSSRGNGSQKENIQ